MATWDIFHADRLELERGQSTQAIRAALARGDLRDDDLVRPSGTTIPWVRIADIPELLLPASEPVLEPRPSETERLPRLPGPTIDSRISRNSSRASRKSSRPPRRTIPPSCPERQLPMSRFPFSMSQNQARSAPRGTPAPLASSPAWIWADDDDETRTKTKRMSEIIEDQGDIEILADDALDDHGPGSAGVTKGQATTQPAVPGRSSEARSRRVESHTVAEPHEGWEPSEDDLDLDVIESSRSSRVALPVVHSRDRDGTVMPVEADEEPEAEFSLSRSATQRIEELDLAPMVDVAFQLVLFFMVTATTILYKTLEIPKPSGEAPAGAVAQGRSRSLDDLKDDYILVEIDDRGAMKLDRQPIEPVRETLVENLRRAREKTGRKAMLLAADFGTLHRHAVLAYDAAQEIGLSIAIAKPKPPQGPAPTLRAAPAAPQIRPQLLCRPRGPILSRAVSF